MYNKTYTLEDLKIILIITLVLFSILVISFKDKENRGKNLQEAFNSGEVLICSDTLIVTNSNWKLTDSNLINSNSAGYLDIYKCKIKGK